MTNYDIDTSEKLLDIAKKHADCIKDYDNIIATYTKKLMSIGTDLHGVFFPENEVYKYSIGHGRLTKNEKKRDFAYYFDEKDRLILTERYSDDGDDKAEKKLISLIFYYYYEDLTEIVWYSFRKNAVNAVEFIEYKNSNLIKYVQSYDIIFDLKYSEILSYKEHIYNADDKFIIKRTFCPNFIDGKDRETVGKIKKF
ncbi:MAG: hypothetical protein J6B79_05910 [Clostridia bacterium]|nr:hypothetical protein [Clostridia bacterium]